MNRIDKIATLFLAIFPVPFRVSEKKQWKNKRYLVWQFIDHEEPQNLIDKRAI
jgi:hypothetical protein